jgi:hypothetical protein
MAKKAKKYTVADSLIEHHNLTLLLSLLVTYFVYFGYNY